MIQIRAPIWNGGKRCVGIAIHKINPNSIYTVFEVLYKDQQGERLYPHPLRVDTGTLLAGRKQTVGGGVELRVVPLAACEVSR